MVILLQFVKEIVLGYQPMDFCNDIIEVTLHIIAYQVIIGDVWDCIVAAYAYCV